MSELCVAISTDPCKQATLQSYSTRKKTYTLVQNISFQKLCLPLQLSSEDGQ